MSNFTMERDRNGKLRAKTTIVLGFDSRELHVETSKSYRGGVSCEATVFKVTENCMQHAMGLGRGGDFSRTLARNPDARATEKTIRTMHVGAMAGIDAIVAEATTYYAEGRDKVR